MLIPSLLIKTLIVLLIVLQIVPVYAATYYIDITGGNDANNGTSKVTPWAHARGMPTCTNVCLSTTPVAGDSFIFKGGETWGNANFNWTWSWSGNVSNRIYLGVDQTWYTGSSWTRPKFNAESTIMSGGNRFLTEGGNYVTVDNFEFTGFLYVAGQGFGNSIMINPGTSDFVTFRNNYFHNYSSEVDPGDVRAVVATTQYPTLNEDLTFEYNVFSGKDNHFVVDDPNCTINCYSEGFFIYGSVVYAIGNVCEYTTNCFITHSMKEVAYNLFTELRLAPNANSPDPTHGNMFEELAAAHGLSLFHDNVLHTNRAFGYVTFWIQPGIGDTTYVWNNVIVNTGGSNIVNLGDSSPLQAACCGTVVFVNNTVECGPDGDTIWTTIVNFITTFHTGESDVTHVCVDLTGPDGPITATIKNNHFITSNATPINVRAGATLTEQTNNVVQTRAQALAQGYTFAQSPYKFAPTTVDGATVDAGVSLASDCAIMTTLCSDTRYGVVYDDVAHTARLYGRTGLARGDGWDAGAYQFDGAAPRRFSPTLNLRRTALDADDLPDPLTPEAYALVHY